MPTGLATIAILFASLAPVVSGHEVVDLECAPAVATEHDHNAHRIAGTHAPAPDHCAACHLTRTVRDGAPIAALVERLAGTEAAVPPAPHALADAERRSPSTRGPPRIA